MLWAQWVFPFFLSVLHCSPAGLAVYCENFAFIDLQLWQFCFSHQKTLFFSGSLKWVLSVHLGASHRKIEFFSFTQTTFYVHEKNSIFLCSAPRFTDKTHFRSPEKNKVFDSRSKTGIIAHQWNKFSQCTANPAGSQSKTKRKTEKPILLRAFSFFHATNALVGSESEKKVPFSYCPSSAFEFDLLK